MTTRCLALPRSYYSGRSFQSVFVGLWFMVLAGIMSAQENPKIRIGIEFNSPPLSYVEADGRPQGFTPELLRAMEATGQVEFEIVPNYWSNILVKFETGQLDALANVQVLVERRETMEFSIPHASLHAVAYTQPGVLPVTTTAQFAGKKMATLAGTTSQRNAIEHDGWGAQIVEFESWQAMLQSVQDGGCDFALVLRSLSFEQPDELGLNQAFVEDIVHEFRIAVHTGDHATLERINEALAEVREGVIFRKLKAKWIGPIEPQEIRWEDLRPYHFPVIAILAMVGLLFFWLRRQNQRLRAKTRELQAGQDMLNDAGRIAQVGGWELDLKTQRVFWSDETCRLHAVEPGAAPPVEEAINFYAPECRPIIEAAVRSGMEQGTPWDLELELIDANGRRFWARAQGAPESENGKVVKLRGAFQDITTRKQGEHELQALQQVTQGILNAIPVRVFWKDRNLTYLGCNKAFARDAGFADAQDLIGKDDSQLVWHDQAGRYRDDDRRVIEAGGPTMNIEEPQTKPDGTRITLLTSKIPLLSSSGEIYGMIGTYFDITERKRLEEDLKSSLHEKEALLKEVHHRVKNNMQVISSLLRLETAKRTDPETKEALRDMQGRIRSMALLHETLYRSGDFARVNLGDYLRDLGTQFFRALNIAPRSVALGFELSVVEVEIDQAIPCGLIVNELLTNALKYGFPEGRSGKVMVGVCSTATGEVQLQVSDDGVGLPPNLDIKNSKSLGLRLVSDLARQLLGELVIETPAKFTIRFRPKLVRDSKPPFVSPNKIQAEGSP